MMHVSMYACQLVNTCALSSSAACSGLLHAIEGDRACSMTRLDAAVKVSLRLLKGPDVRFATTKALDADMRLTFAVLKDSVRSVSSFLFRFLSSSCFRFSTIDSRRYFEAS